MSGNPSGGLAFLLAPNVSCRGPDLLAPMYLIGVPILSIGMLLIGERPVSPLPDIRFTFLLHDYDPRDTTS